MTESQGQHESVLDRIVRHKRTEIDAAKKLRSLDVVKSNALATKSPPSFLNAITGENRISLIAEVKKASPSKGVIRDDFDPVNIARIYEASGATCLSVLTDENFFQGHLSYLREVIKAVSIPVLRKDFILEPYQVYEAREVGASAVLLIAECLDAQTLADLRALIESLEMTALVEFYDQENLSKVLDCGATLVGVNNRNLHTFETDLDHTVRMKQQLPETSVLVGESGIRTREDALRLEQHGVAAMLVGESLMARSDIAEAVHELLGTTA